MRVNTAIIIGTIAGLIALIASSCAHVATVAKACEPTTADVQTVAADLALDGYVSAMEAFAIGKTLCVVNAAVREVLSSQGGKLSLGPKGEAVERHGHEWLTTHPE